MGLRTTMRMKVGYYLFSHVTLCFVWFSADPASVNPSKRLGISHLTMSTSSGVAVSHDLVEAYAEANTNDTRFIIVSIRGGESYEYHRQWHWSWTEFTAQNPWS